MIRDSQRQRAYDWQTDYLDKLSKPLSLNECEKLIQKACLRYSKVMPKIADGRGTRRARGGANLINLPRHSRDIISVLHEVAHSILLGKGNRSAAWHGPEFVRLFIELMAWQKIASIADLRTSARKYKLKVATATAAGPKPDNWRKALGRSIDILVDSYCGKFKLRPYEVRSAIQNILSRR